MDRFSLSSLNHISIDDIIITTLIFNSDIMQKYMIYLLNSSLKKLNIQKFYKMKMILLKCKSDDQKLLKYSIMCLKILSI